MWIPDGLIAKYLRLTAPLDPSEIDAIERGLRTASVHPNEAKRRLAREVVDLYHGAGAGAAAEEGFNLVHREREMPGEIADVRVPASVFGEKDGDGVVYVPALLEAMGLVASRSEARRLQAQGGVRMDGEQVPDEEIPSRERPRAGSRGPSGRSAGGSSHASRVWRTVRWALEQRFEVGGSVDGRTRTAILPVRRNSPRVLDCSDQGVCVLSHLEN